MTRGQYPVVAAVSVQVERYLEDLNNKNDKKIIQDTLYNNRKFIEDIRKLAIEDKKQQNKPSKGGNLGSRKNNPQQPNINPIKFLNESNIQNKRTNKGQKQDRKKSFVEEAKEVRRNPFTLVK